MTPLVAAAIASKTQPSAQQPVVVQQPSRIKEVVIYSALGLLIAGTAIHFGTKKVKKVVSNVEEKKSLNPDSSAKIAKQINMAFSNDDFMYVGWGTDEIALRKIFRDIPDKETFYLVGESYKRNYGSPM